MVLCPLILVLQVGRDGLYRMHVILPLLPSTGNNQVISGGLECMPTRKQSTQLW